MNPKGYVSCWTSLLLLLPKNNAPPDKVLEWTQAKERCVLNETCVLTLSISKRKKIFILEARKMKAPRFRRTPEKLSRRGKQKEATLTCRSGKI